MRPRDCSSRRTGEVRWTYSVAFNLKSKMKTGAQNANQTMGSERT
jgi:hypothetical protein